MRCGALLPIAFALGCTEAPARSEAAPFDAGTHVRAAPDASRNDAGAGFCGTQSGASFCDDFDRPDFASTWDLVQSSPPGAATRDTSAYTSAPASFGLVTPDVAAAELGSIFLRKTVLGPATRAILSFQIAADAMPDQGTLAIATLDLALDHLLTLYLRDDDPTSPGPTLTEAAPGASQSVRNPFVRTPPPGKWARVEIDADTARGRVIVRIDGDPALDVAIARAPALDPTIRVGALVTGPAGAYTMRFDDVTLDLVR